jgi:hypothetical protein
MQPQSQAVPPQQQQQQQQQQPGGYPAPQMSAYANHQYTNGTLQGVGAAPCANQVNKMVGQYGAYGATQGAGQQASVLQRQQSPQTRDNRYFGNL